MIFSFWVINVTFDYQRNIHLIMHYLWRGGRGGGVHGVEGGGGMFFTLVSFQNRNSLSNVSGSLKKFQCVFSIPIGNTCRH